MGVLPHWITRPLRWRVQALVELRVAVAEAATRDLVAAAEARVRAHLADLGREQATAARVWQTESRALTERLDDLAAQIAVAVADLTEGRQALVAAQSEIASLDARQIALDAGVATDLAAMLHRLELIRRQTQAALQEAGLDG